MELVTAFDRSRSAGIRAGVALTSDEVDAEMHVGTEGLGRGTTDCVEIRQRSRVARNHQDLISQLLLGRSRPSFERPVTTKLAPPSRRHLRRSEPHAARAADDYHLFTFVPFHMTSPCEWLLFVLSPLFQVTEVEVVLHPVTRRSAPLQVLAFQDVG